MNSITVLFADDDPEIQDLVRMILEKNGMRIISAFDGHAALEKFRENRCDIVVLDLMMPGINGFEVCQRIRSISDVPILILTARGREQDIINGLEAGADDYIVKPFRVREFTARIQAMLRRVARLRRYGTGKLAFERLVLDVKARRVVFQNRSIEITPLEFELLRYLMQHIGEVISKEDLLQNVWGYRDTIGDNNLIEASIRRLRKKLDIDPNQPEYIQTVWGTGYRFG